MNTSTLSSNTLGHSTGQRTSESQDSELTSSGSHTCKILNQIKSELQEQKQQKRLLKELHIKRVQSLRKELEYLKATEWKYQPIDRYIFGSELQKLKMISFMYSLINVWGITNSSQDEDEEDDSIVAHIDKLTITNILLSENKENYDKKGNNEQGCYYKTGTVTFVGDDYILINNNSMCDYINALAGSLKVGDIVYYLAYKKNKDDEEKICKIISVKEECWDDNVIIPQEKTLKKDIFRKNIIGKVNKREGRIVFISPGEIRFDLNKINSEFIPIIGDWIILEALAEVDDSNTDLTGEILEVNKIQPLRHIVHFDNITNYDPIKEYGTIGKNILFHKIVCESGYIPCVGDKVVPGEPKKFTMLDSFHSKLPTNINLDILIKDKCDVMINDDIKITTNVDEEKEVIIGIHNRGLVNQTLYRGSFMSTKALSQLSLISPLVGTFINLKPSEMIYYRFKCKPKFVGTSEELLVFFFKGFEIGRIIKIIVTPKTIANVQKRKIFKKDNYGSRREINEQTMYITGIRPFRPSPSFKPLNKIFKIPQRFWEITLYNYNKPSVEYEIAIENEIPCLAQKLSFQIYKDRFHALLYLEEIEQAFKLNQYDIESAVMRHYKDYLCLEVLGLAEKRPSLLIGDKAIVSFKWDTCRGNMKYEGYIHKVTNTEIFLKFNKRFHEEYKNEICHVTFVTSSTVMQRCHNAIDLAVSHLGSDFLFPTCIIEKNPQVILDEIDSEEKAPHIKRKLKRYESISSVSSSTTSDSFDTIKLLPRVSVADRLFKLNQPEESKNIDNSNLENSKDKDIDLNKNKDNIKEEDINLNKDKDNNKNTLDLSVSSNSPITNNESILNKCISQIKKRKLNWFNKNLNYYQKEAVKNILKGVARPLPYVIFGPPGTGKSVTLCETILQLFTIVHDSRLLVATPSNSSANLILERLLDSNILKPGDVVRLIAYHCLDDGTIPPQLLPYCETADTLENPRKQPESSNQEFKINVTEAIIGRHRITIATCTALGALFSVKYSRNHFSHVLIDEAGQATEPEIMIPLSFIHADYGQAILAGDPLQLGPVIQGRLSQHFGLEESFLSRILHQFPYQRDPEGFETGYDPRLVTKLVMNYRSLPEILELPNSLFYDSELQPKISCKNSDEANLLQLLAEELPERAKSPPAVLFHGVKGENLKDNDSPSWYNLEEATQVYLYLLRFYKYGITADDIGIVTPYQKQVSQIRQLLLESNIACPKVSSVEGFQGQERKIIILSTVRSSTNFIKEDIKHALGFVASPKRLNVAITRARALLIILGNPELLAKDPYWRSILIFCLKRNAYTGCNFFPFLLDNSIANADNVFKET
ncbi:hypothetical protein M0802_007038 [Mischocyttarus mexicanus]|nr:hypothetical protein M0802_007038 [Mischocyttarus mexicanus]